MGFLIRWIAAFILLSATFNPTPWNYISWSRENGSDQLPLLVFLGLLLVVGYIIFLRATLRSIGLIGMLLIVAILTSAVWVLIDYGLFTLEDQDTNIWVALVILSLVFGIGLSWSLARRRISGQADVDDVDE